MYSDSHLHCAFSSDSDTPPEEQIRRAIALGMHQMTFTDHYDPDFPPDEFDFLLDFDAYFWQLSELREKYRRQIDIGIGMELGLQPALSAPPEETVNRYPFDFIIGSTHVTRGIDPYYTEKLMQGCTEEQAYRIYFEEELENLTRYDCWDIAGHLDYVVRYGPHRNRDYTWERYGDVLEEILKTVIQKGKGIEINTAGFAAGLGYAHPMPAVWKRYRELGGELLTIGSDAHTPDRLGQHFQEAADFLKSLGFRYYTVFRERQPQFLPL